jgi:hypothetical protein
MIYPEWVLKHKKKGTYVNCVKGRYYLYAAHSERIPGTKKVNRIFDGYLGQITEEDGFIPTKDKVSTDILVYEFGFSCFMLEFCKDELADFRLIVGNNANLIVVACLLALLYGKVDNQTFSRSYLSVVFPDVDFTRQPDQEVSTQVAKGIHQIRGCLDKLSLKDRAVVFDELPYVYKIRLNDRWYPSKLNDTVSSIVEKFSLKWRF